MTTLSAGQLYGLARNAGLSPAASVIAAAVALAESQGNPDAVGDRALTDSKWGPSVGLWQIRSLRAEYGKGTSRDESRLTDPAFNARAMAEISGAGASWQPWSVYTSGSYRKYLAPATEASQNSDGKVGNLGEQAGDAASAAVDGLAGLLPFAHWQTDLTGVALKLGVTVAALALVVAGVKASAGADA